MATSATTITAPAVPRASRGLWGDAARRLLRNRPALIGLTIIAILVVVAILAPVIAPYDPLDRIPGAVYKPPSLEHLMGTDKQSHDVFSRMWGALCLGLFGAWATVLRWRRAGTGERLLLLWLDVGILEMLIHDVGNERRFVFLIPALVALASLVLARGSLLGEEAREVSRTKVLLAAPALIYSAYDPENSIKAAREYATRRKTHVGNTLMLLLDHAGEWVARDDVRRAGGDSGDRRVRELRTRKGWTQEQLAEAARVTRVCIVAVEGGKQNVSMDIVVRMANALGIKPEGLLTGEDES